MQARYNVIQDYVKQKCSSVQVDFDAMEAAANKHNEQVQQRDKKREEQMKTELLRNRQAHEELEVATSRLLIVQEEEEKRAKEIRDQFNREYSDRPNTQQSLPVKLQEAAFMGSYQSRALDKKDMELFDIKDSELEHAAD